ncbi:small subunit processome component 20 homolog [Bacillus rossius redtenbacheri]|uniref:small subunit processome component 20 homolog n=1 Tax=Bacillus rossius redtenbacheri TaxID=93214 RepID=UPI002FDD54F1
MKTKPTRHKNDNTFKFQLFSERIAGIDVDVFHRVGHRYEDASEEEGTHVHQCLQKWSVLNLSESYDRLRRRFPSVETLPQLLNKKDEVVALLLEFVELRDSLSLQPVLELIVALARDLHHDFYPHYGGVLRSLVGVLVAKDPEQLEWVFTCLAYLFKFLWRSLARDAPAVLDGLVPLLSPAWPAHVNNFAAEGFAFVARKVKDKRRFLQLVLGHLRERPDCVAGCGRLLFEVVRGVSGQLHSCAEAVLPVYLRALGDEDVPVELLSAVLQHVVACACSELKPDKCAVLWTCIYGAVDSFSEEGRTDAVLRAVGLARQLVAWKQGLWVCGSETLARRLGALLASSAPEVSALAADLAALLLQSRHARLPQEHASLLANQVLDLPQREVLLRFFESVFDYSGFESLVLPRLLAHCWDAGADSGVLRLLARLVLRKSPPCASGVELAGWRQYPLCFPDDTGGMKLNFPSLLLKILQVEETDDLLASLESCLCVLICLPHLKVLSKNNAVGAVRNVTNIVMKALMKRTEEESFTSYPEAIPKPEREATNKLTFLFSVAMETLVHLEDEVLLGVVDFDQVVDVSLSYATGPEHLCMLRTLDLYLSSLHEQNAEVFSAVLLTKLLDHLESNILSPYHPVRLLTLHVLSLFETASSGAAAGCGLSDWTLFSVSLAAERTPASVHDYREKLQHASKLGFESTRDALLRNPRCSKVPLKFLLGSLYVNFQLLWEPLTKLVVSHAHGMPPGDFWEVFLGQLAVSAELARAKSGELPQVADDFGWDVLDELFNKLQDTEEKPDHTNYRILLWKAMADFSDVSEPRNRDFVPLFISYLENEYLKSNAELASMWNIKQNVIDSVRDAVEDEAMEQEQDGEDEELAEIKQQLLFQPPPPQSRSHSRSGHKTLLAHLTIFTKIKNPKAMFKEMELLKIFSDFLSHKAPDVQKMALDYVLAYRDKGVMPYQEHLYALIDDKTFKNEITMFRIESEGKVIQDHDRSAVMPVILRIVYGKMLARSAKGKAAGQWKRSLVMRFLAGCREEELMAFVEMTFKLFTKHIRDDPVALVDGVLASLDLERVVPPRRLQSAVNMALVVLQQLGSLMGARLQAFLLRVLLCIGALVAGVLRHRDQIHAGYLNSFRTLRNSCLDAVSKFFARFEAYAWSEGEVDALFHVFVWPWLEKLPSEGAYSPTALLRLLATWCSNPRYFLFLAKHREDAEACSPLPCVMQLLRGPRTRPSVTHLIVDMLGNLLTLQEPEERGQAAPIAVNHVRVVGSEVEEELSLTEGLNLGSRLLLPHVDDILSHLQRRLAAAAVRSKGLAPRELGVLARTSELVRDGAQCGMLADLLLPVLARRAGAGEQVVGDLVASLAHLLPRVERPDKYFRSLAPLFGAVGHVGPRKMLCRMLEQASGSVAPERREQARLAAELAAGLNAFDARWVEQPDFDRRLDAFRGVHAALADGRVDADLGALVIHNCFYFLKKETDLSLRDSAGLCLRKVAPAVCNKFRDDAATREFLVDGTVLTLVRAGIGDRSETVQYEAIALLGEMARECGDLHPVLRDLSKLADKADPEVDFFENLQHLQSHRKTRALLKFCHVAGGLDKPPSPRTLTQFVLPLASRFLLSDKYATKNSIVDAAIQTVGTVCRLLPWHQYETILKYYLTKLRSSGEHQKQLIRIVVAVLDAFHFDLSRARAAEGKHGTIETARAEARPGAEPAEDVDAAAEELADEEKLKSALEEPPPPEEASEEVVKAEGAEPREPAIARQTTLARSTAARAVRAIATGLLPQLQRCLAQRTQADTAHKVNRRLAGPDRDEEDILRVPVSLAVVKLLQRLPGHMMDNCLPGVISKLCSFLKSRMDSVRRITRDTMQKIVVALGPAHLGAVVREMAALLTKGFQVHVLAFTVHAVLSALKGAYGRGDVDSCLQDVLEVCKKDLFGAVAEEKDVAQIVNKTSEARSTKSYDIFGILAQHISENCFTDLLMPLKEVLSLSFSHKVVSKVQECLRHVVAGLVENPFVPVESVVIFMYGVASETVPELAMAPNAPKQASGKEGRRLEERTDSFIIRPAPRSRHGAAGAVARSSARTNAHVLVEFGLQLLHALLRKEKLRPGDHKALVDPVVPVLCRCLEGKHVKLTMLSLQCFRWVLKMDLPSMKANVGKVADGLFGILHKYAVAGLSKGDNFTLVVSAFKAVTVLVRDARHHSISTDQLKALLLYAERDLHDHGRQATAFSLLKAVLARRLVAPEMHAVMGKVAALSVTSEAGHVRLLARQVFHQFLMDYPLGKKLEQHLTFYISQLNYELQPGRESALDMMHNVINTFPLPVLTKHSGLFFVTIGARLVNDDAPECRKMAAQCVKSLLLRLGGNARNKLFDIVLLWLEDKKVGHRQLGAQLLGVFAEAEKEALEGRLAGVVPALLDQFGRAPPGAPGRFVRAAGVPTAEGDEDERSRDHLLFQALRTFTKICEHCPAFLKRPEWTEHVCQLADSAQSFLGHPHEWVRLAAAQALGHVFGSLDPAAVAARPPAGGLAGQTRGRLRGLVLDLCAVLQWESSAPELCDQVIKNLVFLGRVLMELPENHEKDDPGEAEENEAADEEDETKNDSKVSLPWMIRQMRRIVNKEIIHNPKSEVLRTSAFKWLGAMAVALDRDRLRALLPLLLPPLVRELSGEDDDARPRLRRLAREVAGVARQRAGSEQYALHAARLQRRLAARRLEKKKARVQLVITDPEKAAKRKIQKQLKKKHDKKIKMEILKGRKPGKRKLTRSLDIDET